MALGKYTRIDGQNSSRNCVTISIVMFVSTCFLGAWMSMSSSIGPLGVGMTLQQFMVGMPKKANLNNADLHEEAPKVNDSRIAVQDDSNFKNLPGNVNVVIPNEPQSSEVGENHESELLDGKIGEKVSLSPIVLEKSALWNEEGNKGSQEKNRGLPDVVGTSNLEVATKKDVDSTIQTQGGKKGSQEKNRGSPDVVDTGNLEVTTEKDVDSTIQAQEENKGSQEKNRESQDVVNISNIDVPTEKDVDSTVQTQEENKGSQQKSRESPDVVNISNLDVPTEKDVDSNIQTQEENKGLQEKNRGSPYVADTSNNEVPTEKDVDSTVQTQEENKGSQTKNNGSPDVVDTSSLEVPTEKDVDSTVRTQEENKGSQTENSGSPDVVDTSNQEGPTEKYVDVTVEKSDSDKETKQVGETETKVEERGGDPEKIPSAWITAKKIQAKMANQTDNSSQKQHTSDVQSGAESDKEKSLKSDVPSSMHKSNYSWKVCNTTAGPDYIPCLDNIQAIKNLRTTSHYEHRERHCPDEAPVCLVPLPKGYKTPIKWPKSRDMIWFSNVPHTMLAEYKGGQNWVKVYDRYLTFPGGGTQFKYGALHYIDYVEQSVADIAWGRRSRVVLDVGCGVASFGGYLFERDVLTMSLAPKDEHEAQVQFALERGIPAISAVMGTKRLPFPSIVFDVIHCARCRVPWHVEGGKLLLELNRVLRPGGYFVWSATPVYRKDSVNAAIWKDMSELTQSMCWELVKVERDTVNRKAAAIYRKPVTNECYERRQSNDPPLCDETDDPSSAWYTPLKSCIHKVPTNTSERGSQWPPQWPSRLEKAPYWLKGDDASWDIGNDYNRWKHVVSNSYLNGSGIDWSSVRNVMDMRASYGGFAAALKDLKLWVMNVVPVNSSDSDTLPIIYERGLFGIYHDWCESFSTYPRSYDLLHANHLFSDLKKRCTLVAVMAEVDRILRPGGWLIIADDTKTVSEVESIATSLHWKIKFTHSKANEQVFCVEKTMWRPSEVETISSAIG